MSAKGLARGRSKDSATAPLFGQASRTPRKSRTATNVQAPKPDTGFEFYPTPAEAILPILETDLIALPGGVWIDPCAGTGRIVRTVNDVRDDVRWLIVELDERFRPQLEALVRPGRDELLPFGDFIHRDWPFPTADVLVMNPPFEHAFDFARTALTRAHEVLMLQRQGWFGTKGRSAWLRQHCPNVLQLEERPSFTPDGATDSADYPWFHWPRGGHDRREGRVAVLAPPRAGQRDLFTT